MHGNVVSEPVERQARNGSTYTTFRVATTPYRRTPDGRFVDGDTSFYDVIAFNALAANVASALRKGQPVIVTGHISIKSVPEPRRHTAHLAADRRRPHRPRHVLGTGHVRARQPGGGPRSGPHGRSRRPGLGSRDGRGGVGPVGPAPGPRRRRRCRRRRLRPRVGRPDGRDTTTTCSRRGTPRRTTTRWSNGSRPDGGGGQRARTPIRCRARRQIAFCAWPSTSTP